MRESFGLFFIAAGVALMWVGVHGYQGSGLSGVMNTIYGAI